MAKNKKKLESEEDYCIWVFFVHYLQVPTYGRLVTSFNEVDGSNFAHYAVKRVVSGISYFHHFIVMKWEKAKSKIIEYCVSISNMIFGQGEVIERSLSEEEIEQAIEEQTLYVIEDPNYPETEEEKDEAEKRFWERLGEKAYALAYNNCENLAEYILTGNPISEQIRKAGAWKKFLIDTYDHYISNGKMNLLKLAGSLLSYFPVRHFIKLAVKAVMKEAQKAAIRFATPVVAETCTQAAKNLCKYTSKKMGCEVSRLLKSKACVTVAEESSKKALAYTAGTTFVLAGAAEIVFTSIELKKLQEQLAKKHITKRNYDREWNKKVYGAAGATVGSVACGVLGQTICPVPGVGYAIGCAVGNVCGRWLTSAFAGYWFDKTRQ